MATPATLPADFFDKKQANTQAAPDTLPADFFQNKQQQSAPKEPDHAGFWNSLGSDLLETAKGLPKAMASNVPGVQAYHDLKKAIENVKAIRATGTTPDQQAVNDREKQGYGPVYSNVLAPAGEALGVNVKGMEDAASKGDTAGVLGHAAAGAVPYVAPMAAEGALKGAGAAVDAAGQKIAPRMYQSALKPRTTMEPWQRTSAIKTGLDSDIPVSESGFEKLGTLLNDLNSKIDQVIATDPSKTVSKGAVAQRLGDVAKRFSQQAAPSADINAINDVRNDFMATKPAQIPVQDAQAIKKGTYEAVGSRAYGEVKAAQVESEKALARGLKEELENQFPEIKGLNQQESRLFSLEPELQRALGRNSNHQLLGIGTPIAAGAASAVLDSGKAGAIIGTIKAVVDNPMVKSKLAIAINKGSKGQIGMAAAKAKVAAYSAALAQSHGSGQEDSTQP